MHTAASGDIVAWRWQFFPSICSLLAGGNRQSVNLVGSVLTTSTTITQLVRREKSNKMLFAVGPNQPRAESYMDGEDKQTPTRKISSREGAKSAARGGIGKPNAIGHKLEELTCSKTTA